MFRRARASVAADRRPYYYVYISDAKVDMLFSQIPQELRRRLVAELKIDLKIVGISIRQSATEETRYSKLRVVCEYLRRHQRVGTVDEPDEYFAGGLDLRWGPLADTPEIVYFGGRTPKTILGMGGSSVHIIGDPGTGATYAGSTTPYLYAALNRYISLGGVDPTERDRELLGYSGMPRGYETHPTQWAIAVANATDGQDGQPEPLEFMARRVNYLGDFPGGQAVLLATPVFVRYPLEQPSGRTS